MVLSRSHILCHSTSPYLGVFQPTQSPATLFPASNSIRVIRGEIRSISEERHYSKLSKRSCEITCRRSVAEFEGPSIVCSVGSLVPSEFTLMIPPDLALGRGHDRFLQLPLPPYAFTFVEKCYFSRSLIASVSDSAGRLHFGSDLSRPAICSIRAISFSFTPSYLNERWVPGWGRTESGRRRPKAAKSQGVIPTLGEQRDTTGPYSAKATNERRSKE
jgi:hypothetical protein